VAAFNRRVAVTPKHSIATDRGVFALLEIISVNLVLAASQNLYCKRPQRFDRQRLPILGLFSSICVSLMKDMSNQSGTWNTHSRL